MKVAIIASDSREILRDYSPVEPSFGAAPAALFQGFPALPNVELHVISAVRQPVKSPMKIADNIWYHGLVVPKIGWLTTGYQGCIRAVRAKLREIQPDIVHGQGTERNCAISAVFSGYPNVLTIHGNMRLIAKVNQVKPFSYVWLTARLESLTIPRSAGVICITRYTQEAVRYLARRTWVLPNAVDTRFFDVVPSPGRIPEIAVVGTICLRKNQNAFIRALDSMAVKREFRVVFLGDGSPNNPYVQEFLELLKTRPWCEWAGFADGNILRARLSKSTMLALPSIEDNCPMVVLEAMAAGVPVIAPNVGGVPDLVTDSVNGLLCDPTSAESMSSAVQRLLDDPAAASAMAISARKEASDRFHPRHIAARHVEIYRAVLARSS